MSFASSLTICDEANASKSFVEIERSGTKVTRIDSASNLSLPLKMVVSHSSSGSGATATDRHLVQFTKMVEDSNGVQSPVIVNVTIAVPRSAAAGDPQELVGYAINFLIGTNAVRVLDNVDNLILGES